MSPQIKTLRQVVVWTVESFELKIFDSKCQSLRNSLVVHCGLISFALYGSKALPA